MVQHKRGTTIMKTVTWAGQQGCYVINSTDSCPI